ncbi:MAG TPA: TonB-dependent receptor [Steroidobacteraceae bacterium]|nr:TonB-dependent receptor [Steroidobacteraceae bacterium]
MKGAHVCRQCPVIAVSILGLSVWSGTARCQATSVAESSASGLQEIVVTAQRREERLQDVPVSVSAYSQEKLDAQGLRSMDDLTRLTPGVAFLRNGTASSANYNDENADINIRGIDSTAGASTTGIYIDDTPIQSRHISYGTVNAFPALFDLERVEVLRGPQGTLFGAGSEGGTVRFITPEPGLHDYSGYVRSEYATTRGGDPSYEIGAAAGGPVIEDKLAFRASASYRLDGGWVDRVDYRTLAPVDSDANWHETVTFRAALKWAVTDALSITPSFYYQRLALNDTTVYWAGISNPGAGQFRNGNALPDWSNDPLYLAAIKLDWNLGTARLTSNTSYFSRNQRAQTDYTQFNRTVFQLNPRPPVGAAGFSTFVDRQDNFFEEIKLQSAEPSARVAWTAGLFYANVEENAVEFTYDRTLSAEFAQAYGVPLCSAALPCPGGLLYSQPHDSVVDRQIAAFGEVNVKIADAWKATVGLRVAKVDVTGNGYFSGLYEGPVPVTTSGTISQTPVTPRAVLAYQPDRDNMLYASAAKGYRAGGLNSAIGPICSANLSQLGLTTNPEKFDSDSLWSYELGSKTTLLDGRVRVNSSLFIVNWKNIQQTVYMPLCGLQFVANLGEVQSRGGDIDVQVRPVADLTIGFTAAYTDARYTKTVFAGPLRAAPVLPIVTEGNRLPGAPWSLTLSGEYTFPEIAMRRPYLRLDYQFTTAQTALLPGQDAANGSADPTLPGLPQTSFLSMRAGLRWRGLDLSVFGQNLTNAHPLLFESRDTTLTNPPAPYTDDLYFARSVRPRTLGVTATYRY